MGLEINEGKSGSATIPAKKPANNAVASHKRLSNPKDTAQGSLPRGGIAWGFLVLDPVTGRFKLDKPLVTKHIQELSHQLESRKSILGYIKTWNSYASFFASMCGKPANCLGLDHTDMVLEVYQRIQQQLFDSSNIADHLKSEISKRFNVTDIPSGFLHFPLSLGGLDLRNPIISLLQVRSTLVKDPNTIMDAFFSSEEDAFRRAKTAHEGKKNFAPDVMDFDEYTRFREEASPQLLVAYETLLREPDTKTVRLTHHMREEPGGSAERHAVETPPPRARATTTTGREQLQLVWKPDLDGKQLSAYAYEKWILQLYGGEMEARFGGLCAVEKGLLPTGLVHLFRRRRIEW